VPITVLAPGVDAKNTRDPMVLILFSVYSEKDGGNKLTRKRLSE
jgi:hypothetical protein